MTERANMYPVTYNDVKHKMITLTSASASGNSFRASNGWLYGFLKRNRLCLREITRQVKAGQHDDRINRDILRARIIQFHEFLEAQKASVGIDRIINMDQTPVWFTIGSTGKTVEVKGKQTVSSVAPPGNPREKVSVILACTETGDKLPPAIIVKTAKKNGYTTMVNGVLVFFNPISSMANSNIMSEWISVMLPHTARTTMLILDSFRGHLTDQVKHACDENNIVRAVIPGGLTPYCQPLDLTVNRSFKSLLRAYYRKYGLRQERDTNRTIQSFNLDVLTKGVIFAWNRMKQTTICNGFTAMYSSKERYAVSNVV